MPTRAQIKNRDILELKKIGNTEGEKEEEKMSLSRSFISICLQHSRQSRNTVLRAPWVEITCLSDISSSGLVPHDVSSVIGSLPGDTDGSDKSDDSDHSYDLLLRDTDCAWSIIYIQVKPPMVYLLQHFSSLFSFSDSD